MGCISSKKPNFHQYPPAQIPQEKKKRSNQSDIQQNKNECSEQDNHFTSNQVPLSKNTTGIQTSDSTNPQKIDSKKIESGLEVTTHAQGTKTMQVNPAQVYNINQDYVLEESNTKSFKNRKSFLFCVEDVSIF